MTTHCGLSAAPGTAFCGPTAIAAVIGVAPDVVIGAILKHRETVPRPKPRRTAEPVKSMWSSEVAPVLALLGYRVAYQQEPYCTFAQWLRRPRGDGPHVVLVTGHFVAVSGLWLVDTTHRNPIELKRYKRIPFARKRVAMAWRIERIQEEASQ